jgi:hypothetical protein
VDDGDELRSQAAFINALRQVLGLDPLTCQAEPKGGRPLPSTEKERSKEKSHDHRRGSRTGSQ